MELIKQKYRIDVRFEMEDSFIFMNYTTILYFVNK